MFKKHIPLIKQAAQDRPVLAVWIGFFVVALIVLITTATHVRPSELQVVVHFTAFGVTSIYFDSWYYLIAFVMQAVLMFVAHSFITIKLYNLKGRQFAILFLALSIAAGLTIEFLYIGLFNLAVRVQ